MKYSPKTLQLHLSTVMLQYFSQLINVVRTHILFDHAVFKADLLFNYKENMGTLCSTSMKALSQTLKDLLPELSIQVANLHSEINGH